MGTVRILQFIIYIVVFIINNVSLMTTQKRMFGTTLVPLNVLNILCDIFFENVQWF